MAFPPAVVLSSPSLYDVRNIATCVALLRAVNVGGTGKLPMATLVKMCEASGFGKREIYVAYGDGMAGSKLAIPAAKAGTERNINTIAKLVAMAAEI